MNQIDTSAVLSQRYAYATIALVVGLLSFVNLFGFEKSLLAIVLGIKALGESGGKLRQGGAIGNIGCHGNLLGG